MPIIDLQVILIFSIVDTIIDLVIFKLFKIRGLTIFVTFIIQFVVPTLSFMFLVQSGIPMIQQVQALGEYIVSYFFNFFNFIISYVVGFIVSVFVRMVRGEKPPEF